MVPEFIGQFESQFKILFRLPLTSQAGAVAGERPRGMGAVVETDGVIPAQKTEAFGKTEFEFGMQFYSPLR